MSDANLWHLSGNAAEQYEKISARYILGPWAPSLIEAAEIQRDERVLDIGCGTGVVTRAAAKKLGPAGHVTGLDLNKGMLEVARSLGVSGSDDISWVQNSAIEIEFPDDSFDVSCANKIYSFFQIKGKLCEKRIAFYEVAVGRTLAFGAEPVPITMRWAVHSRSTLIRIRHRDI